MFDPKERIATERYIVLATGSRLAVDQGDVARGICL